MHLNQNLLEHWIQTQMEYAGRRLLQIPEYRLKQFDLLDPEVAGILSAYVELKKDPNPGLAHLEMQVKALHRRLDELAKPFDEALIDNLVRNGYPLRGKVEEIKGTSRIVLFEHPGGKFLTRLEGKNMTAFSIGEYVDVRADGSVVRADVPQNGPHEHTPIPLL